VGSPSGENRAGRIVARRSRAGSGSDRPGGTRPTSPEGVAGQAGPQAGWWWVSAAVVPAGRDRGRLGQQREQHGGVGQRSQRRADHGEGVQRVRTPVRPGRRLTTAQIPTTPRRIRSRRRARPAGRRSARWPHHGPRWVPGRCRTRGRRRIDWRSGGLSRPGRTALGGRCSAISSTSVNGTSVTRGDHAGVVPRSIRAGRRDPGAGLLVAARWSPPCLPECCGAPLTDHLLGCRIRATAPAHPPLQGRPGRR
jgi:hypothetical protein